MTFVDSLLQVGGSIAGFGSILWNVINSRRAQIESLYPKLNVSVDTTRNDDSILCSADIENVGTKPVTIRALQFFSRSEGFSAETLFGPAIYSSDIVIVNNRILNRLFEIDKELSQDNLQSAIQKVFNVDLDQISLSEEEYNAMVEKLAEANDITIKGYDKGILVRGAFLVPEIFDEIMKRERLPRKHFPSAFESVLINTDLYFNTKVRKSYDSLGEEAYRLIWEVPAIYTLERDSPLMTLNPVEVGIPNELAPYEKRRFEFRIPIHGDDMYRVRVKLYLTHYVLKKLVLQRETYKTYVYYSSLFD